MGLDRYSIGQISYGTLSCRVISGRLIRHNAVINPTCHKIFFLCNDSPVVKLAVKESHDRLGCALGLLQYVRNAQLIGVTAPAITKTVREVKNSCAGYLQQCVFLMLNLHIVSIFSVSMDPMILLPQLSANTHFHTWCLMKQDQYFLLNMNLRRVDCTCPLTF